MHKLNKNQLINKNYDLSFEYKFLGTNVKNKKI